MANPQVRLTHPSHRMAVRGPPPIRGPSPIRGPPPIRGSPPIRAPGGRPPMPLMQGIANWLGQQTRIRGAMVRGAPTPGSRQPPPPGTPHDRQFQHLRPPAVERYRPSPEPYQPPPDHYQPPPPYRATSPERYKQAQAMCYPSVVPGPHPWDEVPPNMQ